MLYVCYVYYFMYYIYILCIIFYYYIFFYFIYYCCIYYFMLYTCLHYSCKIRHNLEFVLNVQLGSDAVLEFGPFT